MKPPTVAELVDIANKHTTLNISTMDNFLQASGWVSNQSLFEGDGDNKRVTLFAPLDIFWATSANQEMSSRLLEPMWSLHLRDLLANLMLPGFYSEEELAGLDFGETPSLAGGNISLGLIRDPSMEATNG